MKGNVYKMIVRPDMMYSLKTGALTTRKEPKLEVAELKML